MWTGARPEHVVAPGRCPPTPSVEVVGAGWGGRGWVRAGGLEPPQPVGPLGPKPSASASSATLACHERSAAGQPADQPSAEAAWQWARSRSGRAQASTSTLCQSPRMATSALKLTDAVVMMVRRACTRAPAVVAVVADRSFGSRAPPGPVGGTTVRTRRVAPRVPTVTWDGPTDTGYEAARTPTSRPAPNSRRCSSCVADRSRSAITVLLLEGLDVSTVRTWRERA
jgi:hypothetical protein